MRGQFDSGRLKHEEGRETSLMREGLVQDVPECVCESPLSAQA